MDEKKRPMGFKTPAQEMQESIEKIQGLLDKEKANWGNVRQLSMAQLVKTKAIIEEQIATKKSAMVLMTNSNYLLYTSLMATIAQLGEELTTTHKRLASVEKSIKELNRRIR